MKQLTIKDIRDLQPCYDPDTYLAEDWSGTIIDILDDKRIPFSDRLWVVLRTDFVSEKLMRLFAVWCARQVQHLMTDQRSINALDVAERFANGQATDAERTAAETAARDAAWAAAEAAAGDAARDATRAAAWDAAETAAETAAEAAARDAARAAARDAAWGAAWAAAWDTAWDTAETAARDAQETKLREMILSEEANR